MCETACATRRVHRISGLDRSATLMCELSNRGDATGARVAIGVHAHDNVRWRIGQMLPGKVEGIAFAATLRIVALPNHGAGRLCVRGGLVGAIVGDDDDPCPLRDLLLNLGYRGRNAIG